MHRPLPRNRYWLRFLAFHIQSIIGIFRKLSLGLVWERHTLRLLIYANSTQEIFCSVGSQFFHRYATLAWLLLTHWDTWAIWFLILLWIFLWNTLFLNRWATYRKDIKIILILINLPLERQYHARKWITNEECIIKLTINKY